MKRMRIQADQLMRSLLLIAALMVMIHQPLQGAVSATATAEAMIDSSTPVQAQLITVVSGMDSVILDPVTGLLWEVKNDDGGPRDKDRLFAWEEAKGYGSKELDQLNNGKGYGGLKGWRLPTVKELFSIVDFDTFQPAVSDMLHDPEKASFCQPSMYWTATTPGADLFRACYVDFFDGTVLQEIKTYQLYVRLVHSPVKGTVK